MAGLEGMSEDDENLERNASMKTWLVLGFPPLPPSLSLLLFSFILFCLSTILLPGNLRRTTEGHEGQLALNGFNTIN